MSTITIICLCLVWWLIGFTPYIIYTKCRYGCVLIEDLGLGILFGLIGIITPFAILANFLVNIIPWDKKIW